MSVRAAFLGVILIWSTTPLAIRWSTDGSDFAFAVFARMLIGALVAALLIALWRIDFPRHRRALLAYLVGGAGLYGGMALTYWSARLLPSGLISVIFGLSPLLAGLFAALFLGEKALTPWRIAGTLLGLAGLARIFLQDGSHPAALPVIGVAALLLAVLIYSATMVAMKRIGDHSPPLATTLGTLLVSLPAFFLTWWVGGEPLSLPAPRALGAIVYLGVFGSVLGFALYYYTLRHMEASRVALATLVTPVMALALGQWLNGERIAPEVTSGTALIMAGLLAYQSDQWLGRWRASRAGA